MNISELEKAVAEVKLDTQAGATALTLKTIDIYRQYVEQTMVSCKLSFLRDLEQLEIMLKSIQPSMASLSNVIDIISRCAAENQCLSLFDLKKSLMTLLINLKTDIFKAKAQIVQNVLGFFPEQAVVITLSESSIIEEVIIQAYAAKKVSRVIIAESRPLCEGLHFANKLIKIGIPVTVIVDAALGFFCKDVDLAIVGADTIQSDGSVINKVGTYTLALACHDLKKPLYVACDTLKFSKTRNPNNLIKIETKPPEEIVDLASLPGADIKNIYFDVTPLKYLTCIVTEKGVISLSK
jgi:translation initiation factor eIF-2B subunit delta